MYVFLGVTRYLKAQFQLSQVPQPKNNNNRFFQDQRVQPSSFPFAIALTFCPLLPL